MKRTIALGPGVLDVFLVLFLILGLGNGLYSANRGMQAINLLPMWVLLSAICLVTHRGRKHPFLVLLLVLAALSAIEFWRVGVSAQSVLLTLFVYTPCMLFFTLMGSVAVNDLEEKTSELERRLVGKRREIRALEEARRKDDGPPEPAVPAAAASGATEDREKRELYRFNARVLPRLTNVASASDLPSLFEKLFSEELGIMQGMAVMRDPSDGALVAVSRWGFDPTEELLRTHLESPLAGWAFEKGHMILEKEILTHPQLADSRAAFFEEIFPLTCMLPIRQGGVVVLVLFVGQQRSTTALRFRESIVAPLLQILESLLAG